jgi:DNA (cytosine-5)-methyltransferase 1
VKAISLFSGAEGFGLGFERAGIETVLQAEIDPWCLGVLEHHWPNTRRVNDVRAIRGFAYGVDLVYGGFPCQDLSVAGARAGLAGERSGLWHEFRRVLQELRPAWCVIENVPGLLSSNRGLDFAVLLHGLEELGYGWSYRVLDAQGFGVAQRRRRVFIVGSLGGEQRAEQVLAECPCGGGNSQEGREAGEGTTGSLSAGTLRAGGVNGGNNPAGGYVAELAYAIAAREAKGVSLLESQTNYIAGGGVRRLTPLECERLMGWPDDWTRWAVKDGKAVEVPDSHRYRMCGNGVVSNVAEWLGRRLVEVDRWQDE